jgi:hypothetical protein
MKSTRKPSSHGEDLFRAQEDTIRDLLALERLRIESRERLELASMKEARASEDRRGRWYDALAQVLPEALARLSTMVAGFPGGSPGVVPIAGHGVRLVPTPEPAPADPASARAPIDPSDDLDAFDRDDEIDAAPEANNAAPEATREPAPAPPPVTNGASSVSPHPLAHLYGNAEH